jgi:hypothetical protein
MTNYVAALMHLVPNANIRYQGIDITYEDIEWLDERTQPSKEDCDAVWPQVNYEQEYARIERARRQRYTEETDGMFFAVQRSDGDLSDWILAVDQIKSELPYPENLQS